MYTWDRFYVGGTWVKPERPGALAVISPSSEAPVGSVPVATKGDIDRAVGAARLAFDEGPWPRMTMAERTAIMQRIAAHLRGRIPEIADILASEVGMPFSRSPRMIERGIFYLDEALQAAPRLMEPEVRRDLSGIGLVLREPIGVVGAIVPWNGPFSMALAKVMPALAVGCTVVLKPPAQTPLNGFIIAEACEAAGLPAGVLNIVPGDGEVGEHLVQHADVDIVSFTGSSPVGRRIGAICGEQVKRVCLELGGKSAAIVLEDADMAVAGPALASGIFSGSGQACIALSRILAPRSRYDEVVELMRQGASQQVVGDPFSPDTMMGPLVSDRQRARVESYIAIGREEGARLVCGGGRPAHLRKGWYVEPTVFADARNDMRIAQEEIFGPVVTIIPYDAEDDAIRMANDTNYGLGGAVFTADEQKGLSIARRVHAGTCAVNSYGHTASVPFGGIKSSGLGREHGPEGVAEYLEYKAITITETLASSIARSQSLETV